MIAERLKQGYVRDPHVSVEIEAYRPFFILGEVTNPGQYPYVANMTAETPVAIAGGFAPRASSARSSSPATRRPADARRRAAELSAAARRHARRERAVVLDRVSSRPPSESASRTIATMLSRRCGLWVPALAGDVAPCLHAPSYFIFLPGTLASGSRRDRRRPCCSSRARRNKSRAAHPDRRRSPPAAASP